MANDPSLDDLNPDVALDDNSISDTSDQSIDDQLGSFPVPDNSDPEPSPDLPVEDQLDDGDDGSSSAGSVPLPGVKPAAPITADQMQALVNKFLTARREQISAADARRLEEQRIAAERSRRPAPPQYPPQPPTPPAPPLPPSEQDPVRYQYYLKLCQFMEPRQALALVNQQDEYYEARFQKQFGKAMEQFAPYFQRTAQEAYMADLDNLADMHVQRFHSAASRFGVTPEESEAVVFAHLKAYIDSGHNDLNDINSWFTANSANILAATIEEKRKILDEEKHKNTKNAYLDSKNKSSTVIPSTKLANQKLVSTGDEARMKSDGAITGGAGSGGPANPSSGLIRSLMEQTGINGFTAN